MGKWTIFSYFSNYIENGAIAVSATVKLQSLLDVLYLGHILDTFVHFIGIIKGSTCKI